MVKKWNIALFAIAVLILAGCQNKSEEAAESEENKDSKKTTLEEEVEFQNAPMLTERVDAEELPAVEERLPVEEDIMVEPVEEQIGQYGGDLNIPWKGVDDKWTVGKPTEEPLFRFTENGEDVEPNVAKGYDVNEESTKYTIYLREGMKWSDGKPLTADDVLFYWEHMLIPETFGKELYDCYYSVNPETGERTRGEVTKIDDYTVEVTFQDSHPLFLERLAIDNKWFFAPAHFYKQILPEFVGEEEALEIAEEWGFNDLASFGSETGYYYWIWPERPTLRAWVASNDPSSSRFIMERNPYYWKTDADGNQLPYLDRLVVDKVEDDSHLLLKTLAGEVDFIGFGFSNFTVLKENERQGNYQVNNWSKTDWASTMLQLNQTVKDPNWRDLFQDIRFREALSVAVDRDEVSEIVTDGLADPQQASVQEGLPNYQEGWAEKWTAYDPERANELLDELGLKWDENHAFRTFPDGSDMNFIIDQTESGNETDEKFQELLKNYFEEVGIKTTINAVDQSLYHEMLYSNQITASTDTVDPVKVSLRPDTVVPLGQGTAWYSEYGEFFASNGESGIEPEGDIAKVQEYWNNLRASDSREDIQHWSNEIIKLHEENMWVIGYTGPLPTAVVSKNDLKNVPESRVFADEFRDLGHAHPEQFYKEQ